MKSKLIFPFIILVIFTKTVLAQGKLSQGEHFAEVNGLKMHYYVEGTGPVCLFPSPGWGLSVDYARSISVLKKHFTVVFYDTRHSGKTNGPDDYRHYTGKYFTDDMDALRIYLGQPKVWVAGHSAGGFQVLRYGIHYSVNLNGIIAIDALAVADSMYLAEAHKQMLKRVNKPYFTWKRADMVLGLDTTKRTLQEDLSQTFEFYFHDPAKMKLFPANYTLNDMAWDYTNKAETFSENLLPDLKRISVPVLVLAGDDDVVCDAISQAIRIYQNVPHANMAIFNDSGHCPWIEQPAAFDTAVEAWLSEILASQMDQK
ncbi:alpha/beta fold hydrolase [Mucilaginibacter jinjuensis]|uniref:Alpha/beta hydrolase n=1 Tax=Mucilaginibacter jinjuensis TaxID=1176721 RepID=A0ABY7TAE4_9SPHI|nr:alpha/beta hydrolase [Mucilaginibacter jinjuensis]WCT13396.1 alpha/beta hydrolase [Mucilaginibacter jinjuensis]